MDREACCCCCMASVVSDSSDPMNCSPPGSSVHRIFQAKVLEWGAVCCSSWGCKESDMTELLN